MECNKICTIWYNISKKLQTNANEHFIRQWNSIIYSTTKQNIKKPVVSNYKNFYNYIRMYSRKQNYWYGILWGIRTTVLHIKSLFQAAPKSRFKTMRYEQYQEHRIVFLLQAAIGLRSMIKFAITSIEMFK